MVKFNCKFCKQKITTKDIEDHLSECITINIEEESGYLFEFMSQSSITGKQYFIFAIVGLDCKMSHIDKFLKSIWCECCNHMVTIDAMEYDFPNNSIICKKINKTNLISKLEKYNEFQYCYDMGSTTQIQFRILKKMNPIHKQEHSFKNVSNTNIKIIYQNEPYKLKCHGCKKKNSEFIYESDFYCMKCKLELENTEDKDELEGLFLITNSPRVGICEYSLSGFCCV